MKLRNRSYGSTLKELPNPANLPPSADSTALAASAVLQAPPKEFTPFPRLPLEIRMRIWQIAMKDIKRVIEIMIYSVRGYPRHYYTDAVLPVILSVSKESRLFALEILEEDYELNGWTVTFYDEDCGTLADAGERLKNYYCDLVEDEDRDGFVTTHDCCPRPSKNRVDEDGCPEFEHYINFTTDIIYLRLGHNSAKRWAAHLDMCQDDPVRQVAIGFDYVHDGEWEEDDDCPLWEVICWPKLKHVLLVFGDDCCSQDTTQHRRIKRFSKRGVTCPAQYQDRLAEFEEGFTKHWKEEVCKAKKHKKKREKVPKITLVRAIRE